MTVVGNLEQQADTLEREAAAIRKLIEAARELGEERVSALLAPMMNGNGNGNGHVPDTDAVTESAVAVESPRGREAVRIIVNERPGLWTLTDLRAEMKRREWFTSNKGVDVAV